MLCFFKIFSVFANKITKLENKITKLENKITKFMLILC